MGTKVVDYAGSYAYSGIKHAVSVMTEGLRRELRDMGTKIRVTVRLVQRACTSVDTKIN
jgi:NADP-dependent 3-hydroxy acid dehydrogenase YdfG